MDIGVIKISFYYAIISNHCKVIKIIYKVVIDHAMTTSKMVLLGNEHKVCVKLLHWLTCIGQQKSFCTLELNCQC
jgi:hypothetical protein